MRLTGGGYWERHSRATLMAFSLMLIVVIGSAYYIYTYGWSNNDKDVVITDFEVSIGFYCPSENLTGVMTILYENNSEFVVLEVDENGFIPSTVFHTEGGYKLYYVGFDNGINFGPVTYVVNAQDLLLIDRDFVGVQVTIRTV